MSSLEGALEEERREVLKILEGQKNRGQQGAPSSRQGGRTDSPLGTRSPVRSMLDISDTTPAPRHASIAGSGVGITNTSPPGSARTPIVRSLLGPSGGGSKSSSRERSGSSEQGSIYDGHHRASSDGSSYPRPSVERYGHNPSQDYQFEMLPANSANALPKRVSQGGRKSGSKQGSMATVMQGSTLGDTLRDRGRHNSLAGTGIGQQKNQSRSPASRFGRSQSPRTRNLNTNSFNLMANPGTFVGERGQVIDLSNAYRRLSDAALLKSGGSLSSLPSRAEHIRADSGEALSPTGGVRLVKDYYGDDEDAVVESSEEDYHSSDQELYGTRGRGRKGRRGSGGEADVEASDEDNKSGQLKKNSRQPLSLLAAAEEERQHVSSANYKVKSMLMPDVTLTGPGGEKVVTKKAGVHPSTSFDYAAASANSENNITSDTDADISDIRRAQRMNIRFSPISSTPESQRCIRTIIRGEFGEMQKEAEEGTRRQRTYLVATDLSDEAAHALEWTVGTVLRDGDTLMAIFAIDSEVSKTSVRDKASKSTEAYLATKDQATIVGSQTKHAISTKPAPSPSPLSPLSAAFSSRGASANNSPDGRAKSKTEEERIHALEEISARIVRLLRKTRLQVRVVIEVLHCEEPKHVICEVIDYIEPTLVVLGSRGRSALKGVLLGSFSNYLVQKSSVPVMVARKRLKKHSKYKRANVRLSNNLTPGKSLAYAKID